MKIPFYTLPKADRRDLADTIESLTKSMEMAKMDHARYSNLVASAQLQIDYLEDRIKKIREKYDWD